MDFITDGPNVKRNEINVKCPFCGPRDPSYHMGLHPAGLWACWRNDQHSGSNPSYLIRRLLGVSPEVAKALVADRGKTASPIEELRARNRDLELSSSTLLMPQRFPDEFRRPRKGDRFWSYLERRGFDDVRAVVRDYDLRCAMSGPQKLRVIFPIKINGSLVGWSGRAVGGSQAKYKTWPAGDEAIGPHVVYNQDQAAEGGIVLVIVEGPLDALKLDFYGRDLGVRSVGLMGLNFSPGKLELIGDLADGFDRVGVLLDPEARRQALSGRGALSFLPRRSLVPGRFLAGWEDPGALTPRAARNLAAALTA